MLRTCFWIGRRLLRVLWSARRSNQSILRKSTLNIYWKDWCQSSNNLTTWCKEPTQWKRPSEGQGSLACCSLWGHKSGIWLSDWTTTTNKILIKYIKEDSNKQKDIPCSWIRRILVKWPYYPKQSTVMWSVSNYPWHFSQN